MKKLLILCLLPLLISCGTPTTQNQGSSNQSFDYNKAADVSEKVDEYSKLVLPVAEAAPAPYGQAAQAGLAILSMASSAAALYFRKKANDNHAIAETVVKGVEFSGDKTTKDTIRSTSISSGVAPLVEKFVQKVVGT